jgi:tetratricopeptide (TPR) repeat protein
LKSLVNIILVALVITSTTQYALGIKSLTTSHYVSSLIDSASAARDNKEFAKALNYSLLALNSSGTNDSAKYHSHKNLSTVLWELGASRDALNHLYIALSLNRNEAIEDEVNNAIILGTIGSYHLALNQIDSSIAVFKTAIDVLSNLDNPLFLASANNNLGLAYAKAENYNQALNAYKQAFKTIDNSQAGHLRFCSVVKANMANVYIKTGEYKRAKALLIESIQLMDENGSKGKWVKLLGQYTLLIETKSEIQDFDGINSLIDSVYSQIATHPKPILAYETALRVSKVQLKIPNINIEAAQQKRLELSDSLIRKLEFVNKGISEGLNQYKSSILEQQSTINNLKQREIKSSLQIEKDKTRRFQLLALVVFIFSGALAWLIWLYQKRKKDQALYDKSLGALELENQRLVEKEMAMEIERKKSDLLQLALDNTKKLDWNNEVMSRIRSMRKAGREDIDKMLKDIEIEMAQQLATDNKRAILQAKVEEINQEFKDKLKSSFPTLSNNEIELCAYLKMELSGQDIALIRNVDPKSVTKAKQRLRKKMGLEPSDDLYGYFQKM